MEKLGFKFNFVEAVEPVPTAPTKPPQAVEVVPSDPIPAPAPPVSGGDLALGIEKLEQIKANLENLRLKKSANSI